jgi:hypothetical protein
MISFIAAGLQALTAVILVGVLLIALGTTGQEGAVRASRQGPDLGSPK